MYKDISSYSITLQAFVQLAVSQIVHFVVVMFMVQNIACLVSTCC